MKIAMTHVDLPNESKGGVAYQAHYLANVLVERGHEVTMFTFSPAYEECRYQVYRYPFSPKLRRLKVFLFAAHLGRTDFSKFDIIHSHGDNFLLWRYHPQIRTFHGSAVDEAQSAVTLPRRIYQGIMVSLEKIGARVAEANVGVSRDTKARIPAISVVIPCGVDLSRFCPGYKEEKPTILFVGTVSGRKRGSLLAEVFRKEVKLRFPDAELWLVTDKPVEEDGIVNFGRVPLETLCDLYRRAWVFCLPSTYEGFGVPYIEAMASGTPVIATPNPGANEVLDAGKYGLIVKDDELGQQICSLLSNEHLRKSYADQGLSRAQEYSWKKVAQAYEKLYASFIKV